MQPRIEQTHATLSPAPQNRYRIKDMGTPVCGAQGLAGSLTAIHLDDNILSDENTRQMQILYESPTATGSVGPTFQETSHQIPLENRGCSPAWNTQIAARPTIPARTSKISRITKQNNTGPVVNGNGVRTAASWRDRTAWGGLLMSHKQGSEKPVGSSDGLSMHELNAKASAIHSSTAATAAMWALPPHRRPGRNSQSWTKAPSSSNYSTQYTAWKRRKPCYVGVLPTEILAFGQKALPELPEVLTSAIEQQSDCPPTQTGKRGAARRSALRSTSANRKHTTRSKLGSSMPNQFTPMAFVEPTRRGSSISLAIIPPLGNATSLRLRSGSVVTFISPEQNAWAQPIYLSGPIRLEEPHLQQRRSSIASMESFLDAVEALDGADLARRASDDATLDDIVDYFKGFRFEE